MIKFGTQEPKTTKEFLARLSDVEKIQIRMAQTPERLDHMRQNQFTSDMIDYRTMIEAHAALVTQFEAHPETGGF